VVEEAAAAPVLKVTAGELAAAASNATSKEVTAGEVAAATNAMSKELKAARKRDRNVAEENITKVKKKTKVQGKNSVVSKEKGLKKIWNCRSPE